MHSVIQHFQFRLLFMMQQPYKGMQSFGCILFSYVIFCKAQKNFGIFWPFVSLTKKSKIPLKFLSCIFWYAAVFFAIFKSCWPCLKLLQKLKFLTFIYRHCIIYMRIPHKKNAGSVCTTHVPFRT